MIELLGLYC